MSSSQNLSDLALSERLELLRGPKASVLLYSDLVRTNIPIRALIATSPKAKDYSKRMPQAKDVNFPAECATSEALDHILKWTTTKEAIGGAEVRRVPGG